MFSDFICPFCYIGFEVFRKLKPEFDLELDWRGFQIHPEWPAEGMPASEWRNGMSPRIAASGLGKRIQGMAVEAGFEMKPAEILTNSRLALEATEFAKEAGAGEAFEERVYRAYFNEGLQYRAARRCSPISPPRSVCRATTSIWPLIRIDTRCASRTTPSSRIKKASAACQRSSSATIRWSVRRAKRPCGRCSSASAGVFLSD